MVYFYAGCSLKTFAYLDMKLTDSNFKRCKYAYTNFFLSLFLFCTFFMPCVAVHFIWVLKRFPNFPNFPKPILGFLVVWTFKVRGHSNTLYVCLNFGGTRLVLLWEQLPATKITYNTWIPYKGNIIFGL